MQIKVKVAKPDDYLRPEMNASVAFLADQQAARRRRARPAKPVVIVPAGGRQGWRGLRGARRQGRAPRR